MAAENLAQNLTDLGHTATTLMAAQTRLEDLAAADVCVLASPSWDHLGQEGVPHEDFIMLMQQLENAQLPQKPMAVLALGDSSYTVFCGAAAHLQKFILKIGAREVLPPLKIDHYYGDEKLAQQQILTWAKELSTALAQQTA